MEVPEEVDEVAFLRSRLGMTGSKAVSSDSASTSQNLKSSAPVVEYDLDLDYWENPDDLKIPESNVNDGARFWIQNDRDVTFHSVSKQLRIDVFFIAICSSHFFLIMPRVASCCRAFKSCTVQGR